MTAQLGIPPKPCVRWRGRPALKGIDKSQARFCLFHIDRYNPSQGKWNKTPRRVLKERIQNPHLDGVTHKLRLGRFSSSEPDTWNTFDEVCEFLDAAHCQDQVDFSTGVMIDASDFYPAAPKMGEVALGVVLGVDGLTCLDKDECMEPGEPVPPAIANLVESSASFAERSLSDKGVHLFGFADLAEGHPCKLRADGKSGIGDVEFYSNVRAVLMTCNHIGPRGMETLPTLSRELPFRDCSRLFEDVFVDVTGRTSEEWVRDEREQQRGLSEAAARVQAEAREQGLDTTEEAALGWAMRSSRFESLWNGDRSSHTNGDGAIDPSRADFALLGMLANATRGDRLQMERLFRRSSLGQDPARASKLSRSDYLSRSIDRVLQRTDPTRWRGNAPGQCDEPECEECSSSDPEPRGSGSYRDLTKEERDEFFEGLASALCDPAAVQIAEPPSPEQIRANEEGQRVLSCLASWVLDDRQIRRLHSDVCFTSHGVFVNRQEAKVHGGALPCGRSNCPSCYANKIRRRVMEFAQVVLKRVTEPTRLSEMQTLPFRTEAVRFGVIEPWNRAKLWKAIDECRKADGVNYGYAIVEREDGRLAVYTEAPLTEIAAPTRRKGKRLPPSPPMVFTEMRPYLAADQIAQELREAPQKSWNSRLAGRWVIRDEEKKYEMFTVGHHSSLEDVVADLAEMGAHMKASMGPGLCQVTPEQALRNLEARRLTRDENARSPQIDYSPDFTFHFVDEPVPEASWDAFIERHKWVAPQATEEEDGGYTDPEYRDVLLTNPFREHPAHAGEPPG